MEALCYRDQFAKRRNDSPFLMLQFLTGGNYNADSGLFEMPNNAQPRYYFFSDNLRSDHYKGLTPHDLIDIAMYHGLHYNGTLEEGVMFHLIGALSQHGKLGVVCIGSTPKEPICITSKPWMY